MKRRIQEQRPTREQVRHLVDVSHGRGHKRAAELLKPIRRGQDTGGLGREKYFGEYHPMTDGLKSTKEFGAPRRLRLRRTGRYHRR